MNSAIEGATTWEDVLYIDVLPLVILQNVYGNLYEQSENNQRLWEDASSELFAESEFKDRRIAGFIGIWNLPFLRWLKGISAATGEKCSIYYDHERGDTPYESVLWVSHLKSETFDLSSHGGMDEPEWERQVVWSPDGRIESKERGDPDTCPQYL